MRKVVVSEFISLDGVIEEPAWTFPYWSDEIAKFKQAELFGSDSMLLGRVTYDGFAEAWPGRTDEAGYADRFNGMPKAVVTTTLNNLKWNNSTPIHSDIAGEINKLKAKKARTLLSLAAAN